MSRQKVIAKPYGRTGQLESNLNPMIPTSHAECRKGAFLYGFCPIVVPGGP
jgi:hypothetical protein